MGNTDHWPINVGKIPTYSGIFSDTHEIHPTVLCFMKSAEPY